MANRLAKGRGLGLWLIALVPALVLTIACGNSTAIEVGPIGCPACMPTHVPTWKTPVVTDDVAWALGFDPALPSTLAKGLARPADGFLLGSVERPIGARFVFAADPSVRDAPIGYMVVSEFIDSKDAFYMGTPQTLAGVQVYVDVINWKAGTDQTGMTMGWVKDGHGFGLGTIGYETASRVEVVEETTAMVESMLNN